MFEMWTSIVGKGTVLITSWMAILCCEYPAGLMIAATWGAAAFLWRISSLAALIAIALSPLYFLLLGQAGYALPALFLAVAIFLMHRANIARLRAGTEPRIGKKNA